MKTKRRPVRPHERETNYKLDALDYLLFFCLFISLSVLFNLIYKLTIGA